jgi:ubiquinone/menaquinone biosynthesis C-methylase UbiE
MRFLKHPRMQAWLNHPTLFNAWRSLLDGDRAEMRRLLREVLDLQPGEWLLDVCCGTGDYAAIAHSQYVGLDLNSNFIAYARRRHAGTNGKTFIVADATLDNFAPKSFDKALFINALHHFPDDLALRILRQVARLTKERVVIVDLMPDPAHPLRRILVPLDRGDYVRPLEEKTALISQVFEIERQYIYSARVAKEVMCVCRPRERG